MATSSSTFAEKSTGTRREVHRLPEPLPRREALEAEIERLQSVVRDLMHVIHGLSHDLREPVRIVNCYAELLRTRTNAESEPGAREFLHEISAAAQRMDSLLTGILDYGRLLGCNAPVREQVDMNAVLQTALANLQMQIEQSHATVVSYELPKVTGDFAQLTQLMQNLVGNAIKYRSAADPQILVKAERIRREWRFSVQDNGMGIDLEYHQTIFLPFQRVHGRDVPGAGLGLALCRSIVERHGGCIRAESKTGEGSTFIFTLPLHGGPHEHKPGQIERT